MVKGQRSNSQVTRAVKPGCMQLWKSKVHLLLKVLPLLAQTGARCRMHMALQTESQLDLFLKIALAGDEPGIFWFYFIFSLSQLLDHLRALGFTSPSQPNL